MAYSTTRRRYSKPRADLPLFPHATGRWAKKIKGHLLYFDYCKNDPKGEKALADWVTEKDYCLLHGKRQPPARAGLTVADLCNRVLNTKRLTGFGDQTADACTDNEATVSRHISGERPLQNLIPNRVLLHQLQSRNAFVL